MYIEPERKKILEEEAKALENDFNKIFENLNDPVKKRKYIERFVNERLDEKKLQLKFNGEPVFANSGGLFKFCTANESRGLAENLELFSKPKNDLLWRLIYLYEDLEFLPEISNGKQETKQESIPEPINELLEINRIYPNPKEYGTYIPTVSLPDIVSYFLDTGLEITKSFTDVFFRQKNGEIFKAADTTIKQAKSKKRGYSE